VTERAPDFFDVVSNPHFEYETRLFRFPGDEKGLLRAEEYTRNYNAALREALGVSEEDLELPSPSAYGAPSERANKAQTYRDHAAEVTAAYAVPVVQNDEPLPTRYDFDF
jgi:hypothetical protein